MKQRIAAIEEQLVGVHTHQTKMSNHVEQMTSEVKGQKESIDAVTKQVAEKSGQFDRMEDMLSQLIKQGNEQNKRQKTEAASSTSGDAEAGAAAAAAAPMQS